MPRCLQALAVLCVLLMPVTTVAADKFIMSQSASTRHVAITFDDLPAARISFASEFLADATRFRNNNEKMLKSLRKLGVPVAGFVTSDFCPPTWTDAEMRELLLSWAQSGATLANHTSSHRDFGETPREEFFDSVRDGQVYLERMLGEAAVANRYFRTPYLHRGRTAADRKELGDYIRDHGYQMVPVTIDLQDWIFAEIYAWAGSKHDTAMQKATTKAYLAYLDTAIEHFALLSNSVSGREVPHIALLHANALNYDHVEAVIKVFRKREFHFIDVESALKDEVYATPPMLSGSAIRSWQAQRSLPAAKPPDPLLYLGPLYLKYQQDR